ncbi:MAG: CHASE2 domain-containing protein [Microcoleaceae cyanobacterium]
MHKSLKQQIWSWRGVWMAAPIVASLVIGIRLTGVLQTLEWAAWDQLIRWRPAEPKDDRIVIVTIGEEDIQAARRWPISDADLARLIRNIRQQQPRAIGLDIYRDLPVEPGHADLLEVIESTPTLIGIKKVIGTQEQWGIEASPLLEQLGQVGAADVQIDGDRKVRRALLSLQVDESEESITLTLSTRLALMYLESENVQQEEVDAESGTVRLGQAIFKPLNPNDGGYVNLDAGGYQILMNFRSRGYLNPVGFQEIFETASLTSVLNNQVPSDLFKDRVVLIGSTAASLNDLFFTPYSRDLFSISPGVEVHAEMTSQIISGALEGRPIFRVLPEPVEWLWIIFWSGIGATVGWIWRAKRWAILGVTVLGASLTIVAYLACLQGWWIPLVPPMLALTGSTVGVVGYVAATEQRDRAAIMALFSKNVTSKIAEAIWKGRDQLLTEGKIAGQQMTATVLFSDLRGFTRIAEQLEAEILMAWLNDYMDAMAEVILDHNGVVDKFIGDAIMAVFGVPIPNTTCEAIAKDATAAVNCACAMSKRLQTLNAEWKDRGLPTTGMRIGIATGEVVAGSLGSHQRLNYTTIGDSVNVASRLEAYDKTSEQGCCRILMNQMTYEYLIDSVPTQFIGCIQLRGRQKPVNVYQVDF